MTAAGDLALLTGGAACGLIEAAVATGGGELVSCDVRDVDHRPEGSTTAAYRAVVRWGGEERAETFGATTSAVVPDAAGVLSLSDGERTVSVWRFPHDPGLPALPAATDPRSLAAVLRSFGVAVDERGRSLTIRVRAYRPRRRAVIEVRAPGSRLFVKVVRPSRVRDLQHRHALLAVAGSPTPRSLGWTDDGLILLAPLPGVPMRRALWDPTAALPPASALVALLDRLPDSVATFPRRASWTEGAAHYAALIGAALPQEATRASALAAEVERLSFGDAPDEPVHGDFYESQLLLDDGRVTGLLDVDAAGPGHRTDDLACLVGHVAVLATMDPAHAQRLSALAASWFDQLAATGGRRPTDAAARAPVDACDLAARVGGVVLSLATGPHRVQEPEWQALTRRRLDVAEHWVARANGVRSA